MRILSINTFFPCPVRRGMDLLYLNLLKLQARDHDVTVLTLRRSDIESQHIEELADHCRRVVFVEPRNATRLLSKVWRRLLYSLLSVLQWRPRCTFYGAPRELQEAVRRLVAAEHFDLVEIHHSTSASLRDDIGNIPAALYLYDVHYRAKARSVATKRGFAALFAWLGVLQFRRFEKRAVTRFDALLLGQEEDKAEVVRLARPGALVALMPNVIDTDVVRPTSGPPPKARTAVFIGAMTHQANVDAIMYFHRHVWNDVRARVPDAAWSIVGAQPPPEIAALDGHNGVRLYANVPDVKPYIAEAAVYIAPLRIGSGVKVKVMEALAMGKAIVATGVAAEGMGLRSGENIQVAELDAPFRDAIIHLWSNDAYRLALQNNARSFAVEAFSFEAGRQTLNGIYKEFDADPKS
jgi:glycosyltransferase involved in cell wall biosynthesis